MKDPASRHWPQSVAAKAAEAKGAIQPCEACGSAQFLMPSIEGTGRLYTVIAPHLPDEGPMFALMICTHCGNTRFLHVDTLMSGVTEE